LALVTWDTSYSVSVKSCDAEHQKLFDLINQLHEAMQLGQGSTIVVPVVHELEKYTTSEIRRSKGIRNI
jgi:hemerythrin